MKLNKILLILSLGLLIFFPSCNEFLDEKPTSEITPEQYFNSSSDLMAYVDNLYADILPSHTGLYGIFRWDMGTDNQVHSDCDNKYIPGQYKVPAKDASNWNFTYIHDCNYFFSKVLPKKNAGMITGSESDINYYIGEMYVLRAYEYFKRYQKFGDFPIITRPLPDNLDTLSEASKRMPRNEVARFIISDLDKAITLMGNTKKTTTRISSDVAYLLKSRVALFEGTWLQNYKGTAFVPNGDGWPGASKDYNQDYKYPLGDIDSEINYFLNIAMESSKIVADKYYTQLTENLGTLKQDLSEPDNPYMRMYGSVDLSSFPEVLLWREYNKGLGIVNSVGMGVHQYNIACGLTKGLVESFLTTNGLPIYAAGSGYECDSTLSQVIINRDTRLSLWLQIPGQLTVLIKNSDGESSVPVVPSPPDLAQAVTGYYIRKGWNYDEGQGSWNGTVAAISFRATEALLNYMESSYLIKGNIDDDAAKYWKAIRNRALIDDDYQKTINNTDMNKAAEDDWGAYSGGKLVDATLYNIRLERRIEFMAEGLRFMDLCRWRSMDQMKTMMKVQQL